jgi:uncharacterized protein YciI
MKKISLLCTCFIFLLVSISALSQDSARTSKPENQIRQYWFVMLTEGKNRSQDSASAAIIQEEHLANIGRLYMEGKLKVAGPFGDNGKWIGLFIFDCKTKEEVEKLVQTDPAVAAGRLAYEIKPWYTVPTGSFVPGKPKGPLF